MKPALFAIAIVVILLNAVLILTARTPDPHQDESGNCWNIVDCVSIEPAGGE